jgi:type IV pilus assembly protein PilO
MTNLQEGGNRLAIQGQQRLLLGVPIGVGALLALLLVGVGVVPQWLKLQADSERLAQLEEIQGRLPLLRAQIAKTLETQDSAERRQQKVLQLIEGSGELSTFLAQLDRQAARYGVQLDLYEPMAELPPPTVDGRKAAQTNDQPPPAPRPPLEAAGLKAQKVMLVAKGPYPAVLAFLRGTEKLTVLVSQSNLALAVVEPPAEAGQPATQAGNPAGNPGVPLPPVAAPGVAKTELKLMLTYYRSGGALTSSAMPPKT